MRIIHSLSSCTREHSSSTGYRDWMKWLWVVTSIEGASNVSWFRVQSRNFFKYVSSESRQSENANNSSHTCDRWKCMKSRAFVFKRCHKLHLKPSRHLIKTTPKVEKLQRKLTKTSDKRVCEKIKLTWTRRPSALWFCFRLLALISTKHI